MAKEILITKEGLEELKAELDYLKVEKRDEIAEKIAVARSFGDLSENAEYDEAKNDQAKIENRINEIETILKHHKIIEAGSARSKIVNIGATVVVLDVEFDEEQEYKIVGTAEADPMNGKISDESPVGKALLGRSVNDEVEVDLGGEKVVFKVLSIEKQ